MYMELAIVFELPSAFVVGMAQDRYPLACLEATASLELFSAAGYEVYAVHDPSRSDVVQQQQQHHRVAFHQINCACRN